jgi:rod shape-determining protein MreB
MSLLEDVSPAISNDIHKYGIMLTGGCAAMPGMDLAIHRETGLRVTVADRPRDCVIHGIGHILKEPALWGTRLDYRIK